MARGCRCIGKGEIVGLRSRKCSGGGRARTRKVDDMMDKITAKVERFPEGSKASYIKATSGTASPRMAIKVFCTECMGYSLHEAKTCTTVECPLFRYMKRNGGSA
jgi:hypothetical protein